MNDDIPRLHDDGLDAETAARLDARLAALPLEIAPPGIVLEGVRARTDMDRGARTSTPGANGWGGFAVAASLATVAVVVTLSMVNGDRSTPSTAKAPGIDPQTGAQAATTAGRTDDTTGTSTPDTTLVANDRYRTADLPNALGGRAAFGDGFLQVRQEMATDFADRLETLDPATREVVETNLRVIHGALGRIENALASDPGNPVLTDLLMSTYRQELDYMGQVHLMPAPGERSMEL